LSRDFRRRNAGAEARLGEVFDLVNRMQGSNWFLHVEYRGLPSTPPPVKQLRRDLETWIGQLDLNAIDRALNAEDWESLPRFEWQHDEQSLTGLVPIVE
jgi:hypothetical protein